MADKVILNTPNMEDAPDINVINHNLEAIANSYNAHLDETDVSVTVTLLTQIVNETSLYNSDVSAYFSNLEDATTVQDKVNILVNIAKEIAFFNSSNASAFIEALDIQ